MIIASICVDDIPKAEIINHENEIIHRDIKESNITAQVNDIKNEYCIFPPMLLIETKVS